MKETKITNEMKETGATLTQRVYNSLGGGGAEIATAGPEKAQVPSSLRHHPERSYHCHHPAPTTSILKRRRPAAFCQLTECHWLTQFCHANHVRSSTQSAHPLGRAEVVAYPAQQLLSASLSCNTRHGNTSDVQVMSSVRFFSFN